MRDTVKTKQNCAGTKTQCEVCAPALGLIHSLGLQESVSNRSLMEFLCG
jgi:hypothetical protein